MNKFLLFKNTRDLIKAEKSLADAGLLPKIIPVPKYISSECGMAIEFDNVFIGRAFQVINAAGISVRMHENQSFDLLSTVEYGGCSAKISPDKLAEALSAIPRISHERLLVDISTHDDAGVYKLTDDIALIQTLDFFPPVCSDPYEFGQIAAANALSDVYAMGGTALTAMNIVMFPYNRIPLSVLKEILSGGMERVEKAAVMMVGGHTIDDYPPKYGLSVTGVIRPDELVTNAFAKPGDILILTKAIGSGAIIAGKRVGMAKEDDYRAMLESMKLLNLEGAAVMRRHAVKAATDITGFGLLGHARNIAEASKVTIRLNSAKVPLMDGAYDLISAGCVPGATFRNISAIEKDCSFPETIDSAIKLLLFDAQTSGGLLLCVPAKSSEKVLDEMRSVGYMSSRIIGEVTEKNASLIEIWDP
jgi:selenide,water dikinase